MQYNTSLSKYERVIINATREFAKVNDINFTDLTAIMIANTIRHVKKEESLKLKHAKELARAQHLYIKALTEEVRCRSKHDDYKNWLSGDYDKAMELKKNIEILKEKNKEIRTR